MALILAAIVAIGTLVLCALLVFGNSMSDAPSVSGFSVWPPFIGGMALAAILAASHWIHIA